MPAPYALAIDIGTSRTAAATARASASGDVATAAVPLGRASESAPSTVYVGDAELLFGDAAERRGSTRPDRLVREFKRRIGDDVPIVAGERRFDPEELYALVAEWVIGVAAEREGRAPAHVALTVPVGWGTYRTGLVAAAMARHGWPQVDILSEPEAAARHYETSHPLGHGHALAVYDLGGGTFDAVVLAKTPDGVRVVGTPAGIADLGGADFDDAVLRYAIDAAELSAIELAGTAEGRLALAALRRECVEAKESLSFDSDVTLAVIGAGRHSEVRLPRAEFEAMIADDLDRTADALEDGIASAGLPISDVEAILLTGGSSRIPRVAQVLSERFDRPIAIDADPKAIIALGAARAALAGTGTPDDELVGAAQRSADDEQVPAFAAPAPRRSWLRRISPTALAAGACALLLTGAGLAAAPTLGSSMLAGQSAMRNEPQALDAALLGVLQPVVTEAASSPDAEATTPPTRRTGEEWSTPRPNPRRTADTSRTPTTQTPAGRTTSDAGAAASPSVASPRAATPATSGSAADPDGESPGGQPAEPGTTDPGTANEPGTTDPGTTNEPGGTTGTGGADPGGTTEPGGTTDTGGAADPGGGTAPPDPGGTTTPAPDPGTPLPDATPSAG